MRIKRLELQITQEQTDKLLALCPVFKTGSKSEIVRQLIDRAYTAQILNKEGNQT